MKNSGVVAVANFDDDPLPEIYLQAGTHRILEHDGSPAVQCAGSGSNPAAVVDVDGDGKGELLFSNKNHFELMTVVDGSCQSLFDLDVDEADGLSSGTAFDLLADGSPELIHADRSRLRIYDAQGQVLFQANRTARSNRSYPVVVDVDNDGAAEILVVSSRALDNDGSLSQGPTPAVMLFENADDAFAPTRRIWNQHAYLGANIGEDASVPETMAGDWRSFRTNVAPSGPSNLCQGSDPVE
ncbi:MAG: hypothetical protein KC431_32095 [Myxococcales bacterium]|nr:hypothetical protein [Myxococcales bacterium]